MNKILALLIGVVFLAACDRIPGTTANLERRARTVLNDALFDAESAKFQKIKAVAYTEKGKSERLICGEVNAKNRMGAYAGFSRFIAGRDDNVWLVDPKDQTSQEEINDASDACSRARSSRFGSSLASSICKRVDDLIDQRAQQDGFEAVWKTSCESR